MVLSSGTGFIRDPFVAFSSTLKSAARFSGTAVADGPNLGRYTMSGETVFAITYNSKSVPSITTLYQANGGYVTWIETDANGLSGGSLEQLSSNVRSLRNPQRICSL